ncbi:MAG: TIGR00282 family metallophosphoesterase [Candidatus Gastranaerophilales bacterium]|nr:TIGR00282 family metallophosphoesterase [Candidatus Gastranaerophilales bacterium]
MTNTVKIMFLGDITGKSGRFAVKKYIEDLKENKPDFIIANVENASHGFGLTPKNYEELLSYGINCFTSGNHIWDKREIFQYIDKADKLIRPINYPKGTHGYGYRIFETDKCKIGVINVLGRTFMGLFDSPWELLNEAIEEIKKETEIIVIDIHAEATAEKICMAKYYAEQGVSAIIGTHTHVQTADEKIYNGSCAYITDAGFCGCIDSVIGMEYEASIKRMLTAIPERLEVAASGDSQVNGVIFTVDISSGKAESIERINERIINEGNNIMKG